MSSPRGARGVTGPQSMPSTKCGPHGSPPEGRPWEPLGGQRAPHPSRAAEGKEAFGQGSSGLEKVKSRQQRLQGQEQGGLETVQRVQNTDT